MKTIILGLLGLLSLPAFSISSGSVDILDPASLAELDAPGKFSFATFMGQTQLEAHALGKGEVSLNLLRLNALHTSAKFQGLTKTIQQDVDDIKRMSGEKMAYSSEEAEKLAPAGNVARHFDSHFLTSSRSALPLVAVVFRPDKEDESTCGEARFIYRLSYTQGQSKSSLPFFFNLIYSYPKNSSSCSDIAALWTQKSEKRLDKTLLIFKQLELNMQIVRYPSGQKTDFGGQAVYMFRIFKMENNLFVPLPLENTPNVSEILKSKELKDDLLRQLSDPSNLPKIDDGSFILENTKGKLLATRAISLSTAGRGRLTNKPFNLLLGKEAEELNVDVSKLNFIKSKRGLIERLNNLSCVGCHQAGGTAGFHMLGASQKFNSNFNQVILPFSPHYYAERIRREAYVKALVTNVEPQTFRPPSFYPRAKWDSTSAIPSFLPGKVRDLCTVTKHFSIGATCEANSVCRATVGNNALGIDIGECVATPNVTAGHVCRDGMITNAALKLENGDLYALGGTKDSIDIAMTHHQSLGCGNPSGGVPLGRISAACDSNTSEGRLEFVDRLSAGVTPPKQICAMRGGTQFDECAKSVNPPECLKNAKIARGLLDTCYEGHFCREDYICQRLPVEVSRLYAGSEKNLVASRLLKLTEKEIGFCVPNYFVFNMRTDGHLVPEGSKK